MLDRQLLDKMDGSTWPSTFPRSLGTKMKSILTVVIATALLAVFVDAGEHCKCYKVFKTSRRVKTWDQAEEECFALGGHLVKVDNGVENQFIKSFLEKETRRRGQIGWFIGGKSVNGIWQWADGTPMDFDDFPRGDVGVDAVAPTALQVTNYAGIFYDKGAYNWGYVSPRNTDMGYICEYDHC